MLLSYKAGRHWSGTGNSSNDDEDEDDGQRGNRGAYNAAPMSPSASSRAVAVKNAGLQTPSTNPLHRASTSSSAFANTPQRSSSVLGSTTKQSAALREAEHTQQEQLGNLAAAMARLAAGISNLTSANDLLVELAEQQNLASALRAACGGCAAALVGAGVPVPSELFCQHVRG